MMSDAVSFKDTFDKTLRDLRALVLTELDKLEKKFPNKQDESSRSPLSTSSHEVSSEWGFKDTEAEPPRDISRVPKRKRNCRPKPPARRSQAPASGDSSPSETQSLLAVVDCVHVGKTSFAPPSDLSSGEGTTSPKPPQTFGKSMLKSIDESTTEEQNLVVAVDRGSVVEQSWTQLRSGGFRGTRRQKVVGNLLGAQSTRVSVASSLENLPKNIEKGSQAAVGTKASDPVVVASCPESLHDEVLGICRSCNLAKAFGQKGDMVDMLSGDDWIGKWEAKVVLAAVTQARSMNVKHVKIMCIQGGPHCDKEMAAQPKLKKAIKREYGDPSFRVAVEWLEIDEFRERFVIPSNTGLRIFFCHKHSNSLDAVMTLKMKLEEKLPHEQIHCDLETETNDARLAQLQVCSHIILFITKGVASTAHVQSQIRCAMQLGKHILLVMETDSRYGSADLASVVEEASEDIRQVFEENMAIPWSKDPAIQDVAVDKICSVLLSQQRKGITLDSRLVMDGEDILDPIFQTFCRLCGVRLPGASRRIGMWSRLVMAWTSVLVVRNLVAWFWTGKYRNYKTLFTIPVSWTIFAVVQRGCESVLRSGHIQDLLGTHISEVHMIRHVRAMTRRHTYIGCFYILLVLVVVGVAVIPYFKPNTMLLSIGYLVGILVMSAPAAGQAACVFTLFQVAFVLLSADFASAFVHLHPQIRDFGIVQSADNGMIVHVTESSLVRFQRMYTEAWQRAQWLLGKLSQVMALIYLCYISLLCLQLADTIKLAKFGRPHDAISGIRREGWYLTLFQFLFLCLDIIVLCPCVCLQVLERTIRLWVAKLVFTQPSARLAVGAFVKDLEVRYRFGTLSIGAESQPYVVLLVTIRILLMLAEFFILDL